MITLVSFLVCKRKEQKNRFRLASYSVIMFCNQGCNPGSNGTAQGQFFHPNPAQIMGLGRLESGLFSWLKYKLNYALKQAEI